MFGNNVSFSNKKNKRKLESIASELPKDLGATLASRRAVFKKGKHARRSDNAAQIAYARHEKLAAQQPHRVDMIDHGQTEEAPSLCHVNHGSLQCIHATRMVLTRRGRDYST